MITLNRNNRIKGTQGTNILPFQEAKSSCAGQWYLPAGKLEPGEDIAEAAKREVLEETGQHFELSTMLAVEAAGKTRKRM